eukprot:TRINITY_DN3535_c0_g1_i2.p1 TRINITY_DN3535_c0_g1~~TRINITY_DN3535_c0_g1_i2.p1  ORF type:complete len:102 (+),score=21.56 TRINITY_DN3535_c0_g1_i2:72-377(+)
MGACQSSKAPAPEAPTEPALPVLLKRRGAFPSEQAVHEGKASERSVMQTPSSPANEVKLVRITRSDAISRTNLSLLRLDICPSQLCMHSDRNHGTDDAAMT